MRASPIPILEAAGVRLLPTGQDRWRCACPVHGGNRMSMAVRCRNGVWLATCFACGFGGGAADLYAELHRVTIAEALRALSDRQRDEPAPVKLHRQPALMVACDAAGCGARLTRIARAYKVPGTCGPIWETTAYEEILFAAAKCGWQVDVDGAARCWRHLQKDGARLAA